MFLRYVRFQKKVMNSPKKHHFVPEFYQKGFLSEDGELYAYKKTYGSLKSWNPSQILYEKHLHTISIKNQKTLILEEFYSQIEGEFSKYVALLKANIENTNLLANLGKDGDFIRLAKLLVAIQFWRTPCKKKLAIEYSSRLLALYDDSDDEIKEMLGYDRKFVKFISKRAKKDDSIKVVQFLLLPLLSFDLSKNTLNIKLFKAPKGKVFFSSDRPVVYDDIEKLFSFKSFLFPFSKDLLLLGMEKDIESLNINTINLIIENKAFETVISGSKQQLEDLKSNKSSQVKGRSKAAPLIEALGN